jgi:RES domain-containing protein
MKKHPKTDVLARGMNRALKHAAPFVGEAFRATSVEYANRVDLLTGLGAKLNGARWNPPGSFATVYTSMIAEVAISETWLTSGTLVSATLTRSPAHSSGSKSGFRKCST